MADQQNPLDPEIVRKLNSGLELTTDESKKLALNSSLAAKALDAAASATKHLTKTTVDLTKDMYKGELGAAAYNKAITSTTDALGDFIGQFGLIGKAFGFLVKAAGSYAAELNKMSDRMFKSYQTLSKVGVAASDGMMGLAESAQRLGFGLDDVGIENFNKLMSEASQDLAIMGGTAATGRKRFTEFSSSIVRGDIGTQMMMLGQAPEDINEGIAAFMTNQNKLGRLAGKSNDELKAGAENYLLKMDALTKLTGESVKAIQARMDADAREERFRAALLKIEREQGPEAAEMLRRNIAAVGKDAPEIAAGLKDMAAGFVGTEAAAKAFRMGITQVPKDMTKRLGGGMNELAEIADRNVKAHGEYLGATGTFNKTYGNLAEQAQLAGKKNIDYAKEIEKIEAEQRTGGDDLVKNQVEMRQAQMNTRDQLQQLIKAGVGPTTAAMSSFASAVNKVTRALGGTVAEEPPGPQFGGGGSAGTAAAAGPTSQGGGGAGRAGGGAAAPSGGGGGGIGGFVKGLFGGGEAAGGSGTEAGHPPVGGAGGAGAPGAGGGVVDKLLNFIGRLESNGNYNILVGGKTDPNLTNMTVQQILEKQNQMKSQGHESTAVGKYQVIQSTLAGMVKRGVVSLNDTFNQATQDKIGMGLLKVRGLESFEAGKLTAAQFADNLSKEWASLPFNTGKSYYAGVGSNKSGVSRDQFMQVFAATGGIATGPTSGYPATLHGVEAVVPLPDGKTIPVSITNTDLMSQAAPMQGTMNQVSGMMSEFEQNTPDPVKGVLEQMRNDLQSYMEQVTSTKVRDLMEQMVKLQRSQNSTTEKILQTNNS